MQVKFHPSILILFLCSFRHSFSIKCLQCSSPIRRVSQSWDHSCFDGTLLPLPCPLPQNLSATHSHLCVSALYRLGGKGIGGVYLQRTCRAIGEVRQECDPPSSTIDFEKTIDFFCSQTCAHDGCNRHSVQDILSHGHRIIAMKKKNIVILIYSIIFLQMLFSLD